MVLNTAEEIRSEDLPQEFGGARKDSVIRVPIGMPLKKVEKLLFDETLKSTRGDKRLAARLLGVHPRTLYRYLEQQTSQISETITKQPISNSEAIPTESKQSSVENN